MSRYPASGPLTLRVNLAEYKNTQALRSGDITSDFVTLDFCGPEIANQGFKPMIREAAFDASELLHQPNIDGALVGGASLKVASFLAIVAGA